MDKTWQFFEENEELAQEISRKYKISKLLAQILINKSLLDDNEIKKYLQPTRNDFYDPFLMPDMKKAVERIIRARDKNENVLIFGDYDVDGITSTTVLINFLNEIGIKTDYYIPNRLQEGYGLNNKAVEEIAKKGTQLMITVDCGISGVEETEFAKSKGMDVIVTDHHEPGENIPKALAVIDAKLKNSKYPFNQLAGAGVVFKLIQALSIKLNINEKEYLKYLDLVCLGTISDIVPLVDENRVIAKLGLKLFNVTKNIGLKTLLESTGYHSIDSASISFGIAPRINACGRMGVVDKALELLLTNDKNIAEHLTKELNEYNKDRQLKEKTIFEEAIIQINEDDKNNPAIILGKDSWHHGVIGIVSSKITELFFKPSILIGFEGNEGKGSGRSIAGIDLHEAILKCSSNLDKFGGHAMAIGLSIEKKNFKAFKREINEYLRNKNIENIKQIIKIDVTTNIREISMKTVEELNLLEPFGEENKMPLFCIKNLKIDSIRALTGGKHLKLNLRDENMTIGAIGFNLGEKTSEFKIGDKIDVVGALEINEYNGIKEIQINMKDLKKSL